MGQGSRTCLGAMSPGASDLRSLWLGQPCQELLSLGAPWPAWIRTTTYLPLTLASPGLKPSGQASHPIPTHGLDQSQPHERQKEEKQGKGG